MRIVPREVMHDIWQRTVECINSGSVSSGVESERVKAADAENCLRNGDMSGRASGLIVV